MRARPAACVTARLNREVGAREEARAGRQHRGKGATAESAAVSERALERLRWNDGRAAAHAERHHVLGVPTRMKACARRGSSGHAAESTTPAWSARCAARARTWRAQLDEVVVRACARARACARMRGYTSGSGASERKENERDRPTLPTMRWRNLRRARATTEPRRLGGDENKASSTSALRAGVRKRNCRHRRPPRGRWRQRQPQQRLWSPPRRTPRPLRPPPRGLRRPRRSRVKRRRWRQTPRPAPALGP